MTMASSTRSQHPRLLKLRVAGVAIAVLAVLFYLNLAQVDDESQAAWYSSDILVPTIDRVVAERRHEAESDALLEYCLLVTAGVGLLGALAGPPVIRRLSCA
jgi:hypothetical protein